MATRHFVGDVVLHVLTRAKCVVHQRHGEAENPSFQDYTIKCKGERPFRACGMELLATDRQY